MFPAFLPVCACVYVSSIHPSLVQSMVAVKVFAQTESCLVDFENGPVASNTLY